MSILSFETEEERNALISALTSGLEIDVEINTDYYCCSDRENHTIRITLSFDGIYIASSSTSF